MSINNFDNQKIPAVTLTAEAEEYIKKEDISTINITLERLACGCARPKEVPTVSIGAPEKAEYFYEQRANELTVYISKHMTVPIKRIEVTLQENGGECKLYPTGIEYFISGVGNYCKLPGAEEGSEKK